MVSGTAALGPPGDKVAWEATADYLAWDWWRTEFGDADALRLQEELLEGRVRLAPGYAWAHALGDPPAILTDRHSRVLQRRWLDPTYNPNLQEAAQPAR